MSDNAVRARMISIRTALGDAWKGTPMSMADFAELLNAKAGGSRYDSSVVARLEEENGKRRIRLADIAAVAAVDPKRRGKYWLAWGDGADETMQPVVVDDTPTTQPELHTEAPNKNAAQKNRGGGKAS